MNDSKSVPPPPKQGIHLPLVIRAKAMRVVVGSLVTLGILVVALSLDLHSTPSPPSKPHYREAVAALIVVLMPVSVALYFLAWRAVRVTLTAEYIQFRVPGYLIRTVTVPLANIRHARVEKRFVHVGLYGGGYYRDFLIITYDMGESLFLRIIVYHSHDLRALLTTLKQLAPHVKYDANIHRFLNLDE